MNNKSKSVATQLYEFMQSVPFGDEIAMDYYGGINEAYETDYKRVRRAQQDVAVMIDKLSPIKDAELLEALPRAFSGRLSYNGGQFEYTAGQFYNIEVPQAVLAVLEEVSKNRPTNKVCASCGYPLDGYGRCTNPNDND